MHDFQEQCQVDGQRSKNMASRFASSTQQKVEKLLENKDSENTKSGEGEGTVLRIP